MNNKNIIIQVKLSKRSLHPTCFGIPPIWKFYRKISFSLNQIPKDEKYAKYPFRYAKVRVLSKTGIYNSVATAELYEKLKVACSGYYDLDKEGSLNVSFCSFTTLNNFVRSCV